MPRELDKVYAALKAVQGLDSGAHAEGDAATFQNAAVESLTLLFAAVIWDRASRTPDPEQTYKRLFDELSPKALILVSTSVEIVQGLASGRKNEMLDMFLKEVPGGS